MMTMGLQAYRIVRKNTYYGLRVNFNKHGSQSRLLYVRFFDQ